MSHLEDMIQDSLGFLIRGCILASLNAIQAAGLLLTKIVSSLQQAQQVHYVQAGNSGMGRLLALRHMEGNRCVSMPVNYM